MRIQHRTVTKRCAASFHRLTNEHLAWEGYPKDLLCLFHGLANGRPELDGYLENRLINGDIASNEDRKKYCIFSSTDE